MSNSSWFAYVLFLIFIGGLIVMFVYVCLLSSNYQFFSVSPALGVLTGLVSFSFSINLPNQDRIFGFNIDNSPESISTGIEIAETRNSSVLIFLATLLFANLLAVVSITKDGGTVRRFKFN